MRIASLLLTAATFWASGASAEPTAAERIAARTFPSIFQAWNGAEFLHDELHGVTTSLATLETPLATRARHDLHWMGLGAMGLRLPSGATWGEVLAFTAESVTAARAAKSALLAANPNAVVLAEIRYRDAASDYLPMSSPWWLRDARGQRVPGWIEGGYYLLDFAQPDFQDQVAKQCAAAVATGAFDGCFLDWWATETPERLALLRKTRAALGDTGLIIANVNGQLPTASAPLLDGVFMEGLGASFFADWRTAAHNLLWLRDHLRQPPIIALEAWYGSDATVPSGEGRARFAAMRFATALALTHGEAYVLFADPNPLPTPDHLHDWYGFWAKGLGRPRSDPGVERDGLFVRDFDAGTVVLNPTSAPASYEFAEERWSRATGLRGTKHVVAAGDGDIFVP